MADNLFIIQKKTLTAIADAIRYKTGNQFKMKPTEMPKKIMSISGGGSGIDMYLPVMHQIEIDTTMYKPIVAVTTTIKVKTLETFEQLMPISLIED